MLWDYIKEVGDASWEFATRGGEMIEIVICGLAFFLPKYLANPYQSENHFVGGLHFVLKELRGMNMSKRMWFSHFWTSMGKRLVQRMGFGMEKQ